MSIWEHAQTSKVADWARDALKVSRTDGDFEVRRAFYRQLNESNAFDMGEFRQAVAVVRTGIVEAPLDARLLDTLVPALDGELRADVEKFAAAYWNVEPAQRKRDWQALVNRCDPASANMSYLQKLEAGLDLSADLNGVPEAAQELGRRVRDLYPLRPQARAAARDELVEKAALDQGRWTKAAKAFVQSSSDLRRLDAFTPSAVETAGLRMKKTGGAIRKSIKNFSTNGTASQSSESGGSYGWGIAVVLMLGFFGRACERKDRLNSYSTSAPKYGNTQRWTRPPVNSLPASADRQFTPPPIEAKPLPAPPNGASDFRNRPEEWDNRRVPWPTPGRTVGGRPSTIPDPNDWVRKWTDPRTGLPGMPPIQRPFPGDGVIGGRSPSQAYSELLRQQALRQAARKRALPTTKQPNRAAPPVRKPGAPAQPGASTKSNDAKDKRSLPPAKPAPASLPKSSNATESATPPAGKAP